MNDEITVFANAPQPKWIWTLGKNTELQFHVAVAPNLFHRKMQTLLLGIYWKRMG